MPQIPSSLQVVLKRIDRTVHPFLAKKPARSGYYLCKMVRHGSEKLSSLSAMSEFEAVLYIVLGELMGAQDGELKKLYLDTYKDGLKHYLNKGCEKIEEELSSEEKKAIDEVVGLIVDALSFVASSVSDQRVLRAYSYTLNRRSREIERVLKNIDRDAGAGGSE
jgi:hypothetical protein